MSEKTAYYSSHHHDLGKKPLWNTEGLKLPAYIQNVAAALMRDHGMDKSKAIATAVNRCKKWAAGGPDVSPEVRAAAQKAVAEWETAKARARSTPSGASLSVDLAWDEAAHPRAAAGSPAGGQFVAQDSGGKGGEGKGETRKELLRSLMSKKDSKYRKLAAEEAAKKGKSSKGGKSADSKKKGGAEPSAAHLTTRDTGKGGASFKTLPAKGLKSDATDPRKSSESLIGRSRHARDEGGKSKGAAFRTLPAPGGPDRAKARAAVEKLYARNGRQLRGLAKGQGWRKRGDWYVTQQRRNGTMMTVGIRQNGIGFQVSRDGQTATYRTLAEARQAAAA